MTYLPTEQSPGLWQLGAASIQQKLAQMHNVRIVPPVASSFTWPSTTLSYFEHAKQVHISTPEYYEHMPFVGFSALDIPRDVEHLTLNFRNAALIFSQVKSLRTQFPHLESLTLGGLDGPKLCFTTSALNASTYEESSEETICIGPQSLDGLSKLSLPSLEISLSDISHLPSSLVELKGLVITESGDAAAGHIPPWPHGLHTLEVDAASFGGALLDEEGLGLGALQHLSHLRFICVQKLKDSLKVTDKSIAKLPKSLHTLEIRIGGPYNETEGHSLNGRLAALMQAWGANPNPAGAADAAGEKPPHPFFDSPLSDALFALLPKSLENLTVYRWPVALDFSKLTEGPRELQKLKIHESVGWSDLVEFDYFTLPRTLTDLRLPCSRGAWNQDRGFGRPKKGMALAEFNENLGRLPPSLTKLALTELHPEQIQLLPRSLTHLELESCPVRDREAYIKINIEEEAAKMPPLKYLYVEEPGVDSEMDAYPWPFDRLFPNIEYLHVNSHREPKEDGIWEPHASWIHYSDGGFLDTDDWVEFTKKLPRTLKSFRLPPLNSTESYERASFEMIKELPKGLTALSFVGSQSHLDADDFKNLPPHLTFLAFPNTIKPKTIPPGCLPATLRIFANWDAEKVPKEALPPYCRIVPPSSADDPLIEGQWWRASKHYGYTDATTEGDPVRNLDGSN